MKKLYLLLISLSWSICLFAQLTNGTNALEVAKVVPPSPNAAALGKYGDVPVGLYTGIPNINIPLYAISFGQFSLPISLSYYSGGLKVNELASQVGLGWSLNAGGVVTRSVNVKPDENGYMILGKMATLDSLIPHSNNVRQAVNGTWDLVPDNFSFNFNGRSGKFIIDATPQNKVHIIPFQPLDITFSSRLGSFQIIDENGIIYKFNTNETSYTVGTVFEEEYNSSWYLTTIVTPYGNVDFTYASDVDDVISEQSSEVDYTLTAGTCDPMGDGGITNFNVRAATKKLISITSPAGKVNFYNAANRRDATYRSKLDSIVVEDKKGNIIRRFNLKYGYHGSLTNTDIRSRRLRLDSVGEEGSTPNASKWHSFEYYNSANVPLTNAKSQDTWGFNNGVSNSKLLPALDTFIGSRHIVLSGANRSPNFNATITGVLNKITYPTGGTTSFEYELNDYGAKSGKTNTERQKIWNTATASARNTIGQTNPDMIDVKADFSITEPQDVTIYCKGINNGLTSPDGNPSMYLYKVQADNSLVALLERGTFANELTSAMFLLPGNYRIRAMVDNYLNEQSQIKVTSYSLGDTLRTIETGGIRIKKIINRDLINSEPVVRQFTYKYPTDPRRSSGDLVSDFSLLESKLTDKNVWNCRFLVRYSSPVSGMALTHGSHIGYRFVTETSGNGNMGGKLSAFSPGAPFSRLQEYLGGADNFQAAIEGSDKYVEDNDYLRGSLLSETIFDSTGRNLSKTEIIYNFDSLQNGNYFVADILYAYIFAGTNTVYCQTNNCSLVLPTVWGWRLVPSRIFCPWIYETSRKETFYGSPGDVTLIKEIKYYYDNPLHAQLTRQTTIQSDGQTETATTRYPLDFNLPVVLTDPDIAGIKYLQQRHIINVPIERYSMKNAARSVAGVITTYYPDKPYPKTLWGYEDNGSSSVYFPAVINGNVFQKDGRYVSRINFDAYDSTGNMLQQGKTGDIREAYLWGYNNLYPVAKIVGATYAEAAALVNSNILSNPSTPQALRNELNKLRTGLPGAMVNTYTYLPLVGLLSETDVSGRSTFYEYDTFGRLKTIKDDYGKILKEIDYQYTVPLNR
ncbi:RHS repeat domain-containing protein [Chitinophaga arvensicola]|uniref:YD repeat-containing protein n=1 Tax=Chitinophaga arvensicola TaxID=29529 RepID=A0A1I0SAS4_9BACT|nr:RHS repeat domain-containing protein [Chitinophaga arvensicola]SEW52512.1 YD repeat-containing protein [Chitinophaga arvensicola]